MTGGSRRPFGVVFDLDGVLIDSSWAWHAVQNDAAAHLGLPPIAEATFLATFGQGTAADVQSFYPGVDPQLLDELYARFFVGRIDLVEPMPLVIATLARLRAAGIRTAIATNTVRRLATILVARFGLDEGLDLLVCASDVAAAKPAPDVLLAVLRSWNCDAQDVRFVGDAPTDAEAARRAGVPFIGYRRPGDARIDALDELPALVVT